MSVSSVPTDNGGRCHKHYGFKQAYYSGNRARDRTPEKRSGRSRPSSLRLNRESALFRQVPRRICAIPARRIATPWIQSSAEITFVLCERARQKHPRLVQAHDATRRPTPRPAWNDLRGGDRQGRPAAPLFVRCGTVRYQMPSGNFFSLRQQLFHCVSSHGSQITKLGISGCCIFQDFLGEKDSVVSLPHLDRNVPADSFQRNAHVGDCPLVE
jgi:hypothetical protein